MATQGPLQKRWDAHVTRHTIVASLRFTDSGLILGAGTVLARSLDGPTHVADWNRLVALLAVAYRPAFPAHALDHIEKASALWRDGDKALAHIRLAFARLPNLESPDDAYRLFLADIALAEGISPESLIKELGCPGTVRSLLKFDPGQARVPAGQGSRGGQWTTETSYDDTVENVKNPTSGTPHSNPDNARNQEQPVQPRIYEAAGDKQDACEAQYERDIFQCRMVGLRACYAQAAERYAACLAGTQIPPFNY